MGMGMGMDMGMGMGMGMGVGIALIWSEGRKSEVTLGMVVQQGQDVWE